MSRPKSKAPVILIIVDLGSSGIKVVVRLPSGKIRCFSLPPHQIALLPEQAQRLVFEPTLAAANQIWIKVGQDHFAIGVLAKVKFGAQLALNVLKADLAIIKVLAVLWVLQQELKLPPKFSVALSVLLPPGEYADRSRFKANLLAALKSFDAPTGKLEVKLTHLVCLPEGGGIVFQRRRCDPQFANKTIGISTLGGRNANLLVYQEGIESTARTSDLGFLDLVRGVLSRTSGLDAEALAPLIAKAGSKPLPIHFSKVARRSNEADRQQELLEIVQAVQAARQEFLQKLVAWYREVLPPNWDELIFCGGPADYFCEDLRGYFHKPNLGQSAWCHGGVKLPEDFDDLGFGVRLFDAFAAFEQLLVIVNPPVFLNEEEV